MQRREDKRNEDAILQDHKKSLGHAGGSRKAANFAFYQIFDKITKFLVLK
jgi:hypothetical protein